MYVPTVCWMQTDQGETDEAIYSEFSLLYKKCKRQEIITEYLREQGGKGRRKRKERGRERNRVPRI